MVSWKVTGGYMCKKFRRVTFLIVIACMLTSLLGCSRNDWKPEGKLLIPMARKNETLGIYSLDLSNNQSVEEVFLDKQYIEIRYPSTSDRGMLCVGYTESGTYSVLNIKDSKAKILYQTEYEIFHPQYYGENCIVFIMMDEADTAFLYTYDLKNSSLDKIYDDRVDFESRPVLNNDGVILFVAEDKILSEKQKEKSSYTIMQIEGGKEAKLITQGRYANWLNGGKQIIYAKGLSLYTYDIASSKPTRIKKGINLLCTPVFVGDNDVMAFYQRDDTVGFSSVTMRFLTIMHISSGGKIKTLYKNVMLDVVYKYNIFSTSVQGLEWVE